MRTTLVKPLKFILLILCFAGCNVFGSATPRPSSDAEENDIGLSDVEGPGRDLGADESEVLDLSSDLESDPEMGIGCPDSVVDTGHLNRRSIGVETDALHQTRAFGTAGSSTICFEDPIPENVGEGDRIQLSNGTVHIFEKLDPNSVVIHEPLSESLDEPVGFFRAFGSPQIWGDSTTGDLAGERRSEEGILYNDGPFTSVVSLSSATTTAEYFRHLRVAFGHGHLGIAGNGVVIIPNAPGHAVAINEDFFRLTGVEITRWSRNVEMSYDGINLQGSNIWVDRVLVHDDGAPTGNPDCNGITVEAARSFATVSNSIVYNIARAGIIIHQVDDARLRVFNSTVYRTALNDASAFQYGCVHGRNTVNSVIEAVNVATGLCGGPGIAFNVDGTVIGENNSTEDGSGPTIGAVISTLSEEVISTALGEEDFHLQIGSTLVDAGATLVDLDGDIDGGSRPTGAGFDIGADEL